MTDLILPTEEQVERAFRVHCAAYGFDPDYKPNSDISGINFEVLNSGPEQIKGRLRDFLILLLNKDKILGDNANARQLQAQTKTQQAKA